MSIKVALQDLQKEFVNLAERDEAETHQKCAQVILAASGLTLLREKISSGIVNRDSYFSNETGS